MESKIPGGLRKDITLQKQAEKERRAVTSPAGHVQRTYRRHALIEPISGRIVDANPAACTFTAIPGRTLKHAHSGHQYTAKEEVEKRRLMALQEKERYFIFPHRLKNGEIRLVDVYSCHITYNEENLLFSIIFDVTDREKYKEELYREKELLRTTLLSIGDGVVTTDQAGKIMALNRAAEEITGWSEEEAKAVLCPGLQADQ